MEGNKFEKIRGTRDEVWCGTGDANNRRIGKIYLELNKYGKIVSKIKLIRGTLNNNFIIKRVD